MVYHDLIFTDIKRLEACNNLFNQTRRQRQHNLNQSFYSRINYASFVHSLDLSMLQRKDVLRNTLLLDFTIDCQQLRSLNLYNCFTINNDAMINILLQCSQLEKLSLAGATGIDASCFLHHRVLRYGCKRLRHLNLNMNPLFFQSSRRYSTISKLPILETLKLGHVHWNDTRKTSLFVPMMILCANAHTVRLDSMSSPLIQICLQSCRMIQHMTLLRCDLDEELWIQIQQQQQQQRLITFVLDSCIVTDGISKKQKTDTSFQGLMDLDLTRLDWIGFKRMMIPRLVMNHVVSHISGYDLTRFDCPDSMTDDALKTLIHRCPSLTHLSVGLVHPTGNDDDDGHTQRGWTRIKFTTLIQALDTWKTTMTWFELHGGRRGTRHWTDAWKRQQQAFIDYLCTGQKNKQLEVLLLDGLTEPFTTTDIVHLAHQYPAIQYVAFKLQQTHSKDLEQAIQQWNGLEGFLCVNHDNLVQWPNDSWREWKWMDVKQQSFLRWKDIEATG
ncbi:uncharacterized protein BX664DRAFT_326924 [Halteromyces radiatus]|uniref:uncharacterized protein n=1 Tax=Halteromyces radiatus TaxID=101107 RepID=UPI00221E5CC1|nr:uncharacterized protein BX664DRAFT_326924 [Halteromyces radiatus]KAI8097649.1 hypothetical protein BX664DRAFT_326924 [Halteromyces radiatus]